jgi:hypothetical protein
MACLMFRTLLPLGLIWIEFCSGSSAWAAASYRRDVVPIFKTSCLSCHKPRGEGDRISGLDLSSYKSLMRGAQSGPVIAPGQPYKSTLLALTYGKTPLDIRMPYNHPPLSENAFDILRTWVLQGAKNN